MNNKKGFNDFLSNQHESHDDIIEFRNSEDVTTIDNDIFFGKKKEDEGKQKLVDEALTDTLKESSVKKYGWLIGLVIVSNIALLLISRELLFDIDNLKAIFNVGEWLTGVLGFQFLIIIVLLGVFFSKTFKRKSLITTMIQGLTILSALIGIYFGVQYQLSAVRIIIVTVSVFLAVASFVGVVLYVANLKEVTSKQRTTWYSSLAIFLAALVTTNYFVIYWEEEYGFGTELGYVSDEEVMNEFITYINEYIYSKDDYPKNINLFYEGRQEIINSFINEWMDPTTELINQGIPIETKPSKWILGKEWDRKEEGNVMTIRHILQIQSPGLRSHGHEDYFDFILKQETEDGKWQLWEIQNASLQKFNDDEIESSPTTEPTTEPTDTPLGFNEYDDVKLALETYINDICLKGETEELDENRYTTSEKYFTKEGKEYIDSFGEYLVKTYNPSERLGKVEFKEHYFLDETDQTITLKQIIGIRWLSGKIGDTIDVEIIFVSYDEGWRIASFVEMKEE